MVLFIIYSLSLLERMKTDIGGLELSGDLFSKMLASEKPTLQNIDDLDIQVDIKPGPNEDLCSSPQR